MAKEIIVLLVRIFLFIVGIAAVCVGHSEANQALLYAGVTLTVVAFLLSCISRKMDKKRNAPGGKGRICHRTRLPEALSPADRSRCPQIEG